MTNRRRRLKLLEHLLASIQPQSCEPQPKTEEEWVVRFQKFAVEGVNDQEPEYPRMLSRLQNAIEGSRQDPPSVTPAELSDAMRDLLFLTRNAVIAQGAGSHEL